jgi:hypoxanthine-DNA glycosylase
MKKYSFPPIVDDNCRVLILGTMPGNKSLQVNQYYANLQNQFWRIMTAITGDNFITDYEEKKRLLPKNGIALWDVLMHCEREGSLDVNITDEFPNDFADFFKRYPGIEKVGFNGQKAATLFEKYHLQKAGLDYRILPSTSSANTSLNLEAKIAQWQWILRLKKVIVDE